MEPTLDRFISAAHQTTVEVFSFAAAGRSPLAVCEVGWHQDEVLSIIQNSKAVFGENGIQLAYPDGKDYCHDIAGTRKPSLASEIPESEFTEEPSEADNFAEEDEFAPSRFSAERNEYFAEYPVPEDQDFLSLPLKDLNLKFMVSDCFASTKTLTLEFALNSSRFGIFRTAP